MPTILEALNQAKTSIDTVIKTLVQNGAVAPNTVFAVDEIDIAFGKPVVSPGGPGKTSYRYTDVQHLGQPAISLAWEAAGHPDHDADGYALDNRGEPMQSAGPGVAGG